MEYFHFILLVLLLYRVRVLLHQMSVSGAATASHRRHCLSRSRNFCDGKRRASTQVRGVKDDSVSASPSRAERQLFICLACDENLVCLLPLMSSGSRPSQ